MPKLCADEHPAFGAPSGPAVAGSAEPSGAHELKTLILSRHPAIAIETTEEERLDTLLAAVAAETNLTIFEWTITQGLVRRPGTQVVYGTTDPQRMLTAIGELTVDGLYVLKDFDAHIGDPAASRAFRELLERFAAPAQRSTIALVSATLDLPAEVEAQVVRYELQLPGHDEYRVAIEAVVESLRLNGSAEVSIAAADYDAFAAALSGLTLEQARQAVAQVAIDDGMAPSGDGEADGGLSRRLFGSFLTWLQEKRTEVFVVATANDLSALPPELLRKGRFDEIFFVDLPDAAEREAILRIHLSLRKQDPERLDLPRIVATADGFSGAELEQVVIVALLRALQEHRPLDTQLLLDELAATVPLSVSRREDIERLRALAHERFVPVR